MNELISKMIINQESQVINLLSEHNLLQTPLNSIEMESVSYLIAQSLNSLTLNLNLIYVIGLWFPVGRIAWQYHHHHVVLGSVCAGHEWEARILTPS